MIIGVYGLGRFGQFWAQELSAVGIVHGYSRTVKDTLPSCIKLVDYQTLLASDVIVLCVAISAMETVVQQLSRDLRPGILVMDTCSVKVHPVKLMEHYFPTSVSIMGTHPMFGPDSGKNGIKGLPIVMTPVRVECETEQSWVSFFSALGLKVISMTAEEHDREAAYTQGVTHYIGRILKKMNLCPSSIGTLGYQKLLEIIEQTCNDPMQLFYDLQRHNPYTEEMRSRLYTAMKDTMTTIASEKT